MHTGGQGGGGRGRRTGKYRTTPRQISKHFLIKCNKTQNRGTPLAIFPESFDPPRDFGENFRHPVPGFSTRVHLCFIFKVTKKIFFR
jgi:hypothetical protein